MNKGSEGVKIFFTIFTNGLSSDGFSYLDLKNKWYLKTSENTTVAFVSELH